MSSFLFTHSYFLRLDPKQWRLQQPYAPLGTLYAAALLRSEGFAVSLHDVQFTEGAHCLGPVLQAQKPRYLVLYDDGFNYLTKMCLTNMRSAAFEMIGMAKTSGCTVIVSSSDATDHFEMYLEAGADFVLAGEGEMTLLELAKALEAGTADFTEIKGLSYKYGDGIHRTAARPVLRTLDMLPLPAWVLVDLHPYRQAWQKSAGYFSINVATTRGCPYKCNWCAKPIYGSRYNVRSPKQVVSEIRWLREVAGMDHIWFCDDIFGLKPGWVSEFALLMAAEGLRIPFKIQSRADLLLQPKYVHALSDAGCATVWMGAESGSQAILDAMDKGITVEQVAESTSLLRQYGIDPCFFIQFGYLGETSADIDATVEMIARLRPADIGISVSYPLPGTGFYEKVRDELGDKANWTDSNELALMFRNHHSARFYRQLHRYVHRRYRGQKAMEQLKNAWQHPAQINGAALRRIASLALHAPATLLERLRLQKLRKTN